MINTKTKLLVAAALASSICTNAQLLDEFSKKDIHVPQGQAFQKHDRVSPKVKKFIENQKNNKHKIRKVSTKKDILGRNGKGNVEGKTYIVDDSSKEKMDVVIVDIPATSNSEKDSYSSLVTRDFTTGETTYSFNKQKVKKDVFEKKHNNRISNFERKEKNHLVFKKARLNAQEIEDLLDQSETIQIAEIDAKPAIYYPFDYPEIGTYYAEPSDIFGHNGVTNHAHKKNVKGKNIGIYYLELQGCADYTYINSKKYHPIECNYSDYPAGAHAAGVTRILQATAPEADVYGYQTAFPTNVKSFRPPIYVGSVSQVWDITASSEYYRYHAAAFDFLTTEQRIVHFIAAGNTGKEEGNVNHPGTSANSITVGAVLPKAINVGRAHAYVYAPYSSYGNAENGIDKPEIANFTQFLIAQDAYNPYPYGGGYAGLFPGTSAATPYSAGMAALMLSERPDFQYEPEAVKAAFLAASARGVYGNHDTDNNNYTAGIPDYAYLKADRSSYGYWRTPNNGFFDKSGYMTLTQNGIEKGKLYRAAIAWSTEGDYLSDNTIIPQDIDLYVYVNNRLVGSSRSSANPYEVVEFEAPESGTLKIMMHRYRNSDPTQSVLLGYYLAKIN